MVQLVTSIDPRPEFFWINSARMIGYDVPHWRIAEEGGYILLPKAEQDRIIAEQADEALALLQRGLRVHPHSPRLKLEVGQIYLNRLRDFEFTRMYSCTSTELRRPTPFLKPSIWNCRTIQWRRRILYSSASVN
jgi:hypothetical protein